MKLFRIISIALLICGQAAGAPDASAWREALHSDDYAARFAAINALESQIAHASAPKADVAQRAALERELLAYIASANIPELSRAYVIRLLPPVASDATVKQMLQLVLDAKTSRMLGNDAAGLLAVLGDMVPPDTWVKSMLAASDPARELLWSAVALRADPRLAKPLIKHLQKKKLLLNEQAIQTLGAMGGRDASSYLFAQWKQAEGHRRTALARAIVHTGAANAAELKELCTGSEATEIRVAALRQWAKNKEPAALAFLQTQLDAGAGDIDPLVAVVLASRSRPAWDWITQRGPKLSEATIVMVLQQIREQQRKDLEPWVLQRLEGAGEAVALAAMRCLAVVGGSRSTEPLILRMQSPSTKLVAEAMNALAVLQDGSLDQRLKAAIADPKSPEYLTALELISRRNSQGSVALYNELFAHRTPTGAELTTWLRGLERLGNIESVKLLVARLRTEQDPAVVRSVQVAIKRVVIRLEEPERIWREAFLPFLSPPADVDLQSRLLTLLDAIGSPEALAHCIERLKGEDAVLAGAAEQALIRWRNIEVCDYWLTVLQDPAKPEAARDQAVRYIDLTLRSDAQSDSPKLVSEKAAKLFLATENKALRDKLLLLVGGLPNRWKTAFHKEVSVHYETLPDYREQVEALIKKPQKQDQ